MMRPPLSNGEGASDYVNKSVVAGGAKPSAKALYEQRKNYAKREAVTSEVSEYRVQHLATFGLERKGAMLTVDDSIRKLKLLDAKGKIWTQEVFLYVDDKCIKLLDVQDHEELEHFSLSTVQHVQTVIDACDYNNICALALKEPDQKNPDIHLYQCLSVPADVVTADISSGFGDLKHKKGRKNRPETLRKTRESIRSSAFANGLPDSQINVKEKVAKWTQFEREAQFIPPPAAITPRTTNALPEDSAEMQAFKLQRDVEMLNHALDDIELLVAHLRKASEARKELGDRKGKNGRRSGKRKSRDPGIGLLELRARLPPRDGFIDCFQKFKMCFNLLAKLKSSIQNPNAVELVHFIFQALHMVITACPEPSLAQEIRCPLLNKETIEFLQNCLTTDELVLWNQLGEFWKRSRAEFAKDVYFPPYVPRFLSGWEPPPLPFMDSDPSHLAAAIKGQADQVNRHEEALKAAGGSLEDALKPISSISPAESPRRGSMAVNGNDVAGFKQHVQSHVARNQAAQQHQPSTSSRKVCRAMQDYPARNEHELSVRLDDLLDVLDDHKPWWRVRNRDGVDGMVPGNMMLLISSATKSNSASIPTPPPLSPMSSSSGGNMIGQLSSVPPPPPVIPVPPPVVAAPASHVPKLQPVLILPIGNVQLKKAPPRDPKPPRNPPDTQNLQTELRQRVAMQKQRNFVIPRKSVVAGPLAIGTDSTREQVKFWLGSQGFTKVTCDSLGVLNGEQLFSLTKEELKMVCEDEGPRVHSQLLVQKSKQQSREGDSELDRIMRKRRQDVTDTDQS